MKTVEELKEELAPGSALTEPKFVKLLLPVTVAVVVLLLAMETLVAAPLLG